MIGRDDITGVILCGGDARRMQGVEKPLQRLSGLPLVAHVRTRLAPQVRRVVISANREQASYAAWGDDIVADEVPDCGPLGGLVSVHDDDTPYLFACPGDAPFLHPSLVSRLAQALDHTEADVAVPHDGARVQHLFVLLRTGEQASMQTYLERGGRSVHGWLAGRRTITVDAPDIAGSFLNINTAQELVDAERESLPHPHQHREPL